MGTVAVRNVLDGCGTVLRVESFARMSTDIFPDVPAAPRPLPAPLADEPARFTARTLEGLEWVLARELEAVGAHDLRVGRRTIE